MRVFYLIFLYLASSAFLAAVPGVSATDYVLERISNNDALAFSTGEFVNIFALNTV